MPKNIIYLYHNSRCSKSREGLEILQKKIGKDLVVKDYITVGISEDEALAILKKLEEPIQSIVRIKEELFKDLRLDPATFTLSSVAKLLSKYPKLLERPLLVTEKKAVIGRPPQKFLEMKF